MKTKLLTAVVVFFAGIYMSSAQEDTRIGVMLNYGTEVEAIGAGVNAEFPIIENLTISPAFIYYFPGDQFGGSLNWWEINGNANYYFVNNENLGFYGMGGLNYTNVSFDWEGESFGAAESSDGRFGLNLGAGANFSIDSNITPFAEAKYVIIDGGQLVIGAGVKFSI